MSEPGPDLRTRQRDLSVTVVELRPPLAIELAGELRQRVFFAAAEIEDFELVVSQRWVTGLRVAAAASVDGADLARKINAVVDIDIRPQLVVPARKVWTSPHQAQTRPGLFAELEAAEMVVATGEGQMALGGALPRLLRYLDDLLVSVLQKRFSVAEFRYPTLIATKALERAGYFDSFPQHLMFVTRLHNDIDVYREVRKTFAARPVESQLLDHCRDVTYCLPPTMCYHTFEQYRGRTLDAGEIQVITARGKSFRFEAGYADSLERLWDFTIREMVFLGDRGAVIEARQEFMAMIFELITELGLSGHCEVANDPFFGEPGSSERIWSQRMMQLKYELRLPVGSGRDIAVGSFNLHNELFGERFGIRQADGSVATSACAGFGLERLVYAFLSRHGADPAGWPADVAEAVTAERVVRGG